MNKYVKKIQAALAPLDYAQRGQILRDVVQNMNERAESSNDMTEIAAFLVAQLGGDAEEVVTGYAPGQGSPVGQRRCAAGRWRQRRR